MVKIWKASETELKIMLSSDISITTTQSLDAFFTTTQSDTISCNAKNITVTEPEADVDQINLLGKDANDFQCAELDEKVYGMAVITGTLVLDSAEVFETYAFGAGDTINTDWTRWQVGADDRVDISTLARMAATSGEVNMVLDNGIITRMGDIRISGPDGHWEQDFRIVCTPQDFFIEFKD